MTEEKQYIVATDTRDGYKVKITFHGRKIDGRDIFWGYHEIESTAPETVIAKWHEEILDLFAREKEPFVYPMPSIRIGSVENIDRLLTYFFRKRYDEIKSIEYKNCTPVNYDFEYDPNVLY